MYNQTNNFDGINRPLNRKRKTSFWQKAFSYVAGAIILYMFIYLLAGSIQNNFARYCEIHRGEGRLDCIFSENF